MIDLSLHAGGTATAALLAATSTDGGAQRWLIRADVALLLLGAGGLLLGGIRWARRGLGDPLADAPERPNRLTIEATLIPVLAYSLTATLLIGATKGFVGDDPGPRWQLVTNNLTQVIGLLACLFIGARFYEGGAYAFVFGRSNVRLPRPVILIAVCWLAGLVMCGSVLRFTELLLERLRPDYGFPEHAVIRTLLDGPQPAWFVMLLWTGTVVIAPLAEEAFFRGIVQSGVARLARRRSVDGAGTRSRWIGVTVAAIAFGLAHAAQWHAVPALVVFGFVLGLAYELTGSLLVPASVHALFNLKTMVWVTLG